jgi:hypothetical protein
MVINVDKNVLHALDFGDVEDEITVEIGSTFSLVIISEFDGLVMGIGDWGYFDFAQYKLGIGD